MSWPSTRFESIKLVESDSKTANWQRNQSPFNKRVDIRDDEFEFHIDGQTVVVPKLIKKGD